MNTLFAAIRPTAGFEQAIIARLDRPMRLVSGRVNPFVRRAAVAAAAAIVLGGFGYVASEKINNGQLPTFAFGDRIGTGQTLADGNRGRRGNINDLLQSVKDMARGAIVGSTTREMPVVPQDVHQTVEADHFKEQQRSFEAKQKIADARDARAQNRLDDALDLYTQALTLDPTNQDAVGGRDDILSLTGRKSGPSSNINAVAKDTEARRQSIQYSFDTAVEEAQADIQANKITDAKAALARARVARNTDPQVFRDDETRAFDSRIAPVQASLETAGSHLSQNELDQQQAETTARLTNGQSALEQQKRHLITDLVRNARALTEQGRYQESLNVLDQIQTIDPKNEYAVGVRPLIEDRTKLGTAPNEAEEKRIPYNDILRYPGNWPDLSQTRASAIPTSPASDAPTQTTSSTNQNGAGQNAVFGDGHVDFKENPFAGVQRDNIDTINKDANGRTTPASPPPAIPHGPGEGNDSILLPTNSDGDGISDAGVRRYRSSQGQKSADNGGISVAGTGTLLTLSGTNTYTGATTITGGTLSVLASGVQSRPPANVPAISYYQPGATMATADASGQFQLGVSANTGLQLTTPLGNRDARAVEQEKIAKDALALQVTVPSAAQPESAPAAPATTPPAQESQPPAPAPQPFTRKIIRNGTMDFTVDSFDSAFLQVSAIVSEEGGFIATTNSQKMPNGKVEGTITVRIAPDHLDVLVLKLRALGELKDQKITAEDITKEYTDLASELRAARAMEERLLDLIKDGKGAIKDLLAAEKELGDWREKIEKITGQMNYYDNLVSLSTLDLTLTERDIKTPALASDTETVDMGVETEDVEKGRSDAISAIEEVKGRIVESELKAFDAGQLAGKIVADIPSDKAGPVIDHLKQLGKVSRLEVQRQEVTTDGHGNAVNADTLPPGLRVEQKDTRLTLSLYNLANVAPRQTANVELACDDVESSYHAILDRVAKAGGRVLSSNLSRPTPDQVTGTLSFEVKSTDADGVLMDVKQAGQVMNSNVSENPDTNNVTSTKRGFSVNLRSLASVNPREVSNMSIATPDVIASYGKLLSALQGVKARIVLSRLDKEEQGDSTERAETAGFIDFEVKRDDLDAVEHALADAGDLIQRQVMRSTDEQNTLDSKMQFKIGLHNATLLSPRENWTLALESGDVESQQADVLSAVSAAGGRIIDSTLSKESNGHTTAHMIVDVPFNQSAVVVDHVKHEGDLRIVQSTKNPQAPEGRLSRSRLEITIATPEAIISSDHGLWSSIRAGLTTSIAGLMWSLQLIVVGLCFVLPWVAAIWVGWKALKRRKASAS